MQIIITRVWDRIEWTIDFLFFIRSSYKNMKKNNTI